MSQQSSYMKKIAVIGLGYVGLPVAVSFASKGFDVLGFDISPKRLSELKKGQDSTSSVSAEDLSTDTLTFSANEEDLCDRDVLIVAVPTPVDQTKKPDLSPFKSAAETVGRNMKPDAVVVFESTVYPGATEEVAAPLLEQTSGLELGRNFEIGYSPERINPGDKQRGFSDITKIVSASSDKTAKMLAELYGSVVTAGIHLAPSIKVAEASKVIENTQRDLNIALMNELSMLFQQLDIDTRDVLAGSGTKWNFLPFQPGLVGGHCIGVDPYYLTHKAHEIGMTPQVILAGRGTNEAMPAFVAGKIIQEGVKLGLPTPPKIAILGVTYKADVPDTRNSKVVDLVRELEKFGADVAVHDPLADPAEVKAEYGITLSNYETLFGANVVVLAVPHSYYLQGQNGWGKIGGILNNTIGLVADIPALLDRDNIPDGITLWRL
ncbi:UDP-N-acetyl-D-glucosamine 6-dehydrogenase [Roseibium album]|nr:UDP-N-acetyl-D-glucosamine 6-dehydrogenase [Roseibium album]